MQSSLRALKSLAVPAWSRGVAAQSGKRVGIVGLGNIGTAIGNNLLRSGIVPVAYTDLNKSAGDFLKEGGSQYVSTPREVAEASDVVITALTTPPVVRSCVLGDKGVMAGMAKGTTWMDHSTTDYHQTLEFNELAEAKGLHVLEAPITGGLALLKEGNMTVYVGGDKAKFEEHRYLLEKSFANILYMGKMGNATITKVVTNMFAGLHAVALGEALLIARKANIDFDAYFDAVRLSAGNSYVWETEAPLVFNQTFEPGFTIDLHNKDFDLGYQIAREHKVPLELFGLVQQQYLKAEYRYGSKVGSSSPAKLNQDACNVSLAQEGWKDWTYTVKMVPSEMPGRAPTMAVVHKVDPAAADERKKIMAATNADAIHTGSC